MASTDVLDLSCYLLDYVYSQLQCTPNGLPCVKKLAVCEPVDPCCDYLAVYIDGFGASDAIDGCNGFIGRTDVGLRVKLMRPCNDKETCNQTVVNRTEVYNLYIDAVVIRAAIGRFITRISEVLGEDACDVTVQILPLEPVCAQGEQCAGWNTGVIINMTVCDDGNCIYEGDPSLPTRCIGTSFEPDDTPGVEDVEVYE